MQEDLIEKINSLIAKGYTKDAIELLLFELKEFDVSIHQRLLIISNRYSKIQREKSLGLDLSDNENSILISLLEILNDIKDKRDSITNKIKREIDSKNTFKTSEKIKDASNLNSSIRAVTILILLLSVVFYFVKIQDGSNVTSLPGDSIESHKSDSLINQEGNSISSNEEENKIEIEPSSKPIQNSNASSSSTRQSPDSEKIESLRKFCEDQSPVYVQSIYKNSEIVREIVETIGREGCKAYGGEQVSDNFANAEIRYFSPMYKNKAELIQRVLKNKLGIIFEIKIVTSKAFRPEKLGQIDVYYK